MTHRLFLLLAVVGWIANPPMASSAQEDKTAAEAFKEGREAYKEAETAEEKLSILKDFLDRFPNSDYTDYALGLGVELLTNDYEDPERAEKLIETVLGKADNIEVKKQVLFRLTRLYGERKKMDQFIALANDLTEDYDLKYSDLNDLNETAIAYEAWDLALRVSEIAMPLASAAQYRADYPEMVLSDETLERRGRRRKGLTLSQKGWAQAQLGMTDEGIETLKSAIEHSSLNYVGVPETDAQKYLGIALLGQDEYGKAIDYLTADAIFGNQEDALEALERAYVGRTGREEGFDDFKWNLRRDNARKVDAFTLNDYKDNAFDSLGLKGEVVLLSFWNPT